MDRARRRDPWESLLEEMFRDLDNLMLNPKCPYCGWIQDREPDGDVIKCEACGLRFSPKYTPEALRAREERIKELVRHVILTYEARRPEVAGAGLWELSGLLTRYAEMALARLTSLSESFELLGREALAVLDELKWQLIDEITSRIDRAIFHLERWASRGLPQAVLELIARARKLVKRSLGAP